MLMGTGSQLVQVTPLAPVCVIAFLSVAAPPGHELGRWTPSEPSKGLKMDLQASFARMNGLERKPAAQSASQLFPGSPLHWYRCPRQGTTDMETIVSYIKGLVLMPRKDALPLIL